MCVAECLGKQSSDGDDDGNGNDGSAVMVTVQPLAMAFRTEDCQLRFSRIGSTPKLFKKHTVAKRKKQSNEKSRAKEETHLL